MDLLEADEEIRQLAMVLNHSQYKPMAIRETQRMAFAFLRYSRERFLRAGNQYDQAIARTAKAMAECHEWEKQHQGFVEEFIHLCEMTRDKAFRKHETEVRRIRRKLGEKFQEQVTREPVLRRMMSRSRSRPPTPISISARASVLHPKP